MYNRQNSAFNAQLFVEHNPGLEFIEAIGSTSCLAIGSQTKIQCDLGNPYVQNSTTQITMSFKLLVLRPSLGNFTVYSKTSSYSGRNPTVVDYSLESVAEVTISAQSDPEQIDLTKVTSSQVQFLEDIGPLVKHEYNVRNLGPSPAFDLIVFIQWPFQTIDHKPFLYLVDVPLVLVDGVEANDAFCEPNVAVNSAQLTSRFGETKDHLPDESDTSIAMASLRKSKRSVPIENEGIPPKVRKHEVSFK